MIAPQEHRTQATPLLHYEHIPQMTQSNLQCTCTGAPQLQHVKVNVMHYISLPTGQVI